MHLRRRIDLLRETRTSLISQVGLLCVACTQVGAKIVNNVNDSIIDYAIIFSSVSALPPLNCLAAQAAPVGGVTCRIYLHCSPKLLAMTGPAWSWYCGVWEWERGAKHPDSSIICYLSSFGTWRRKTLSLLWSLDNSNPLFSSISLLEQDDLKANQVNQYIYISWLVFSLPQVCCL